MENTEQDAAPTTALVYIEADTHDRHRSVGVFTTICEDADKPQNGPAGYIYTDRGIVTRKVATSLEAKYLKPDTTTERSTYVGKAMLPEHMLDVVLEAIKELVASKCSKTLRIYTTDPVVTYVINNVEGDGQRIHNLELERKKNKKYDSALNLLEYMLTENKKGLDIQIVPLLNNGNQIGASKASFLANIATNVERCSDTAIPYANLKDHWKGFVLKEPLLAMRYGLVYTSDYEDGVTYLADPGNLLYNIGMRSGKTCYGVAITDKVQGSVGALINSSVEQINHPALLIINLDNMYNKNVNMALTQYGAGATRYGDNLDFNLNYIIDNLPLMQETYPVNMTVSGYDTCAKMEEVLREYMDGSFEDGSRAHARTLDITEQFYTNGKLNPDIRQKGSIHKIEIGDMVSDRSRNLILKFGGSIPSINAVGRLASRETKVHLLTWATDEDRHTHKYLMVWETKTGKAIYGNVDTAVIYK